MHTNRQEAIKESAKKTGAELPGWVRALDAPGNAAERFSERLDDYLADVMFAVKKPFRKGPKNIDRPLSMLQMQEEMATRLSMRDMSGHIPDDVLNNPEVLKAFVLQISHAVNSPAATTGHVAPCCHFLSMRCLYCCHCASPSRLQRRPSWRKNRRSPPPWRMALWRRSTTPRRARGWFDTPCTEQEHAAKPHHCGAVSVVDVHRVCMHWMVRFLRVV